MKLSYLQLRLYFFGLSGLAGSVVSRFLTEHTEAPWYIDGFFRTLPLLALWFLSDFFLKRGCRVYYLVEESDTNISSLQLNKAYFIDPIPDRKITYYRVTEVSRIHEGEVLYNGEPRTIILEGPVAPKKGLAILKTDKEGKRFFKNISIHTSF